MNTDQQQWDIVSGVGMTALLVAAGRALESKRPDALITDPYAARFVTRAEPPTPVPLTPEGLREHADPGGMWAAMTEYVGVRSRVFDDFFLGAARDGVRQAVILASGLDTRAFRLEWPDGTRCFELDQPLVLDFKLRVLQEEGARPGCAHRAVPVDLRDDWATALEAAGFDASRPTAWLAEGLLPYLPPRAEERLFKEIDRLSAPGSRVALEQAHEMNESVRDRVFRETSEALGVDMTSLVPEGEKRSVEDQLDALGWEYESRSVRESSRRLGRATTEWPAMADRLVHTFAQRP
ncbi:class I SAM-dependent methyltransferase [Streptomyces sp. NBC_01795]|uniref:class I SAM-dependent methyltransferase n=1 Tax=Streptomyces sp. NBC_01795 TaxID=2975943 RepID=UPI002DD83A26|nr:class I SAM-dependent methyltransferase [Streptomyces sp. NBC_01795]WSA95873.1 class I SAM-dependent methyltransferase [Streptomyces sp. NBC_01795]